MAHIFAQECATLKDAGNDNHFDRKFVGNIYLSCACFQNYPSHSVLIFRRRRRVKYSAKSVHERLRQLCRVYLTRTRSTLRLQPEDQPSTGRGCRGFLFRARRSPQPCGSSPTGSESDIAAIRVRAKPGKVIRAAGRHSSTAHGPQD